MKLHSRGAMSEINMTPLIDIVLVVLIIMMVNIPIQIEEMGLKLPSPIVPPVPPPPDTEQLLIAIYDDGQIALNRKAMSESEMLYELGRRLRPMTKKNVFVDADVVVHWGRVVDMVDLAREAGAANVGLAKVKEEGPLPITSVSAGSGMPRGIMIPGPQVKGEMTEKRADEAIQPLKGQILSCYMNRLAQRGDLAGSMVLYVEIGPQGELLTPPIVEKDGVNDLDLRQCVEHLLPQLKYRPLGGSKPDQSTAWVRYTILYSPG
jgi:biopolymer transport protein ExbD